MEEKKDCEIFIYITIRYLIIQCLLQANPQELVSMNKGYMTLRKNGRF